MVGRCSLIDCQNLFCEIDKYARRLPGGCWVFWSDSNQTEFQDDRTNHEAGVPNQMASPGSNCVVTGQISSKIEAEIEVLIPEISDDTDSTVCDRFAAMPHMTLGWLAPKKKVVSR